MKDTKDQTVLFLFGSRPAEPAILQARVLLRHLPRLGWTVRLAASSPLAAQMLGSRLGQPVEASGSILAGLPILGRLFIRRLPGAPAVVHAWDWQAARAARAVAGPDVRLCLMLADSDLGDLSASRRLLRPADHVTCYSERCSRRLLAAGIPAGQIQVIAPAVESDMLLPSDPQPPAGDSPSPSRRQAARAALGIDPQAAPVMAAPPPVGRGSGHFEAAWGTFILRRAGLPAQLLLPHPGRESARIRRFGASCHEEAGIVTCPAGTSWPDLLAAADVVVIPDRAQADPVLAAWALASGRPVVVRDGIAISVELVGTSTNPLLSPQTCLFTPDARPLSLGRTVLRTWQERQVAASLTKAALEEVRRQCDPSQAAAAVVRLYA